VIPIPPFLVFLVGAPLVLLARGSARRVGLVVLAGVALVITLLLPQGSSWAVPFMEYELVLLHADPLSLFTGYIFAIITFFAILYAAAFAELLRLLVGFEGAMLHVACRATGGDRCEWRAAPPDPRHH